MNNNNNEYFELWNQNYFKPFLVQRIKKKNQLKKKITNKQLILEQQKFWFEQIQNEQKVESIIYSPLINEQQQQKISDLLQKNNIKKSKYAFLSTACVYSIYYLTLKDKWLFYTLIKKNPSFIRKYTRLTLKYLFFPMIVFNLSYLATDNFFKHQLHDQLNKEGFYKDSNLELLFKTKKY